MSKQQHVSVPVYRDGKKISRLYEKLVVMFLSLSVCLSRTHTHTVSVVTP